MCFWENIVIEQTNRDTHRRPQRLCITGLQPLDIKQKKTSPYHHNSDNLLILGDKIITKDIKIYDFNQDYWITPTWYQTKQNQIYF